MNNQLTVQLKEVNEIVTRAYQLIQEAESIRADLETRAAKNHRSRKIYRIVGGLICYFAGNILSSIVLSILVKLRMPDEMAAICSIVGTIGLAVYFYITFAAKIIQSMLGEGGKKYEAALQKAEEYEAEGTKLIDENSDVLSVIPSEYWYPQATDYLYRMVSTNRADSINQALQMFDEQKHRWNVEQANNEMIQQQRQQTNSLASIKTSSKISAAANVVNALSNLSR